ncbi:MAG: choice-of-anchor D domain-containing protein [Bacteroidetes bacterium]|nr:MAG: choice-of-anchor D domain-containing protein [Bacteroidota bacterium]
MKKLISPAYQKHRTLKTYFYMFFCLFLLLNAIPAQAQQYIYGTTQTGGTYGYGVIFRTDTNGGNYQVLHNFNGVNGGLPYGHAPIEYCGKLYGTTTLINWAGANYPQVLYEFELPTATNPTGTYTKKYTFTNASTFWEYRISGLTLYGDKIYGTAGAGTSEPESYYVFEYTPGETNIAIHYLSPSIPYSGPYGTIKLIAKNGLLYGTTTYGGDYGQGTVYSFNPITKQVTLLASFSAATGKHPFFGLVSFGDKMYVGAGSDYIDAELISGEYVVGVISEFDPATNTLTPKVHIPQNIGSSTFITQEIRSGFVLHQGVLYISADTYLLRYNPTNNTLNVVADGVGANVFVGDNVYYTELSEPNVIRKYNMISSTITTTHTFGPNQNARTLMRVSDLLEIEVLGKGEQVADNQVIDDGDVTPRLEDNTDFGKTAIGTPLSRRFTIRNLGNSNLDISAITLTGVNANAFSIVNPPSPNQILTPCETYVLVVSFNATTPVGSIAKATVNIFNNDDDEAVYNFDIQAQVADAFLWGMTKWGGVHNYGVLFRTDLDGTNYQVVHEFDGIDLGNPHGSVTFLNGKIYGTTSMKQTVYGAGEKSAIFEYDPQTKQMLAKYVFPPVLGMPDRTVGTLLAFNGKLYGVSLLGGELSCNDFGAGVLFEYDPVNNPTAVNVLHQFDAVNGSQPMGDLIVINNKLHGTTQNANCIAPNANPYGGIFEYNFNNLSDPNDDTYTATYFNGANGSIPYTGALVSYNGALYGMTRNGGSQDLGVLYKYQNGVITKLIDFNNSIGVKPYGSLTLLNGYLYGLTSGNNSNLFRYSPTTTVFEVLYTFTGGSDGANSMGTLMARNGKLYGLTNSGGDGMGLNLYPGGGVLFEYTPPTAGNAGIMTKHHDFDVSTGCYPWHTALVFGYGAKNSAFAPSNIFIAFDAKRTDDTYVALSWELSQEDNNVGFEVQASADKNAYHKVQFVESAGNGKHTYQIHVAESQSKFFRIKQIDKKGNTRFSPAVFVEGSQVRMYPNPTRESITLDLGAGTDKAQLKIMNTQGIVVWEGEIKERITHLMLPKLAKGMYVAMIDKKGKVQERSIQKIIIE